jgi:hypothetical protein
VAGLVRTENRLWYIRRQNERSRLDGLVELENKGKKLTEALGNTLVDAACEHLIVNAIIVPSRLLSRPVIE